MNVALQFLRTNWERFAHQGYGRAPKLSCVLATPRFRASSHVVFLILSDRDSYPILIAKAPRLTGGQESLDREVFNLEAIQVQTFLKKTSIPKVLAYENFENNMILIQTALPGQAMSSSLVRQKAETFIEAGIQWLTGFHLATGDSCQNQRDWFDRLVARPLKTLLRLFPMSREERHMIAATGELAYPLQHLDIPLVFEHGDFGPPNILARKDGSIGVVDWELAEPSGLPALDLFFFLTLVGFAKRRAKKTANYLTAFRDAYCGRNGWAVPYLSRYAEKLNLPSEALKPLFILCWARYVINIVKRFTEGGKIEEPLSEATVFWLRKNRYYALWQYAVSNVNDFNFFR